MTFARIFCLSVVFAAAPLIAAAGRITVFAAASMKTALDAVAADWEADSGNTAVISYAGSSILAKQIQQGAPADLFISASSDWMDALDRDSLLRPGTRRDLLSNHLVLIANGAGALVVTIAPGMDLAGLLGDGKLAMALVDSVPAGVYGKASLVSLGLWDNVRAKVAQVDNVRAALRLVASGETPFGIVYATDAHADPAVSIVGTFP